MLTAGKHTIRIVTRLQDNGDGGYTMYGYNNDDELIADHPKDDEMTPELRDQILNGHDEYDNGYIGSDTIEIFVHEDGTVGLADSLSIHAGQ